MEVGWRGLLRTIVVTAVVTSAVWVLAGAWFFHRHVERDRQRLAEVARTANQAVIEAAPATVSKPPETQGLVGTMVPPVGPVATMDGRLTIPVSGVRADQLVDTFTQAREGGVVHDAIDIPAPLDTPVVAAAPGTVEKLFLSKPGGNTVYVRSADRRTLYYYAHLSRYAPGLREGQVLKRGDPVGFVGYSGNARPTAPHLHFAVMLTDPERKWYEGSRPVNPYPLLAGRPAAAPLSAEGQ